MVTGLTNGTTYYFVVNATTSAGTTGYSNQLSAMPIDPSAPVLNTAISPGPGQMTLSWTAVAGATSYSVKYGTQSGVYGTPVGVGNVTSYAIMGLTNGTYYNFVVTATNAGGTSGDSNVLRNSPKQLAPPVLNTAISIVILIIWISDYEL